MARTLTEERQQYRERETRKYAAAHPEQITPPRIHVNNTTTGLYTGHSMSSARVGADDHQQFKSFGNRAQVKVRTA